MESFFSRYKNPLVLMAVLLVQVIGLATQVKRPDNPRAANSGGTRLIRIWTISAITPIERAFVGTGHFFRNTWHNYVDLHDVRKQNRELQEEVDRLRLEQARLREDADEGRRLKALLGFRDKFIAQTVAAQVIGSSGNEQSHVIYIDKGSRAGLKPDMAVITPDGIVGKIKDVFPLSSQVLLINDRDSGAGILLQSSRLQGILKGSNQGEVFVGDIMSDEKVDQGEQVITSGGDRIYPKGLPVGTVTNAGRDRDSEPFLFIKVRPAANLSRLEEVLVITRTEETPAAAQDSSHARAADILAERLPSVPKTEPKPGTNTGTNPGSTPPKKTGAGTGTNKPAGATNVTGTGAAASTAPRATAGSASGTVNSGAGTVKSANPSKTTGTPTKKTTDNGASGASGSAPAGNSTGTGTTVPKPKKSIEKPDQPPNDTSTAPPDSSGEKPPGSGEKPPR